jgi:16S rRNA (cytidine1402-2'-O)-methyltransferase
MAGTLFLVATPIGNWEDITLRALQVLKEVDLVVYEERKEGSRLLRHYGIEKPVESLNEHNEAGATQVILERIPIPGASSLMSALIVSGFPIHNFLFQGFLSPKRDRRIAELRQLKHETRTVVLMDAPYRLVQLVRDIAEVIGAPRRLCVAFDLTLPTEQIFHGTAPDLYKQFAKEGRKGEFVLMIEGLGK